MDLLAAEITARTGRDPGQHYQALEERFGRSVYERMDAPANAAQRKALANLSPDLVEATEMAGEPIEAKLTRAPGNDAAHRRAESGDGVRLVRRPSLRHRGDLQDLRRKLRGRGTSPADPARGAGDCRRSIQGRRIVGSDRNTVRRPCRTAHHRSRRYPDRARGSHHRTARRNTVRRPCRTAHHRSGRSPDRAASATTAPPDGTRSGDRVERRATVSHGLPTEPDQETVRNNATNLSNNNTRAIIAPINPSERRRKSNG